jgi:hypothetical protein
LVCGAGGVLTHTAIEPCPHPQRDAHDFGQRMALLIAAVGRSGVPAADRQQYRRKHSS